MTSDFKMILRDYEFPISINTSRQSPINDLFVPALKCATKYDVAIGYFSSNWIRDSAEGIAHFIHNGGSSRWVISPELNDDDFNIIKNAEFSADVIESILLKNIDNLVSAIREDARNLLCWMVKDRIMEFRIAIPKNDLAGMFHAKVGIFYDDNGNKLAFNGSYNLTGAANTNWEKIDVFRSWDDSENKRIEIAINEFEEIWDQKDPNLSVYHPSQVLIERIENNANGSRPYKITIENHIKKPDAIHLRDYQKLAIKEWIDNKAKGAFVMATGSGKTITALSALADLSERIKLKENQLFVLIVVPYKHLLEQWCGEAELFHIDPVKCYEASAKWTSILQSKINSLNFGVIDTLVAITTNATFSMDKLQAIIKNISCNFLLIGDEMHNLGATYYASKLPVNANFRLGLSATPDRKGDIDGTEALVKYFGRPVIEFTLKDAIREGYLCEYYYYPILCNMNDEEIDNYRDLSKQIAQEFTRCTEGEISKKLEFLLRERANILSLVEDKLVKLKEILLKNEGSSYNLIYCGSASDDDVRHIEMVMRVAGNELGMKIRKFTSDEDNETRKEILDEFEKGQIDALVAIRCLDEGVDVPRTETAFILSSSTNPRQFIQRRGRVLRKAEGKKYAYIYDFIPVPQINAIDESSVEFKIEQRLMKSELNRINEFVDISKNKHYSLNVLRDIRKHYKLLDT